MRGCKEQLQEMGSPGLTDVLELEMEDEDDRLEAVDGADHDEGCRLKVS